MPPSDITEKDIYEIPDRPPAVAVVEVPEGASQDQRLRSGFEARGFVGPKDPKHDERDGQGGPVEQEVLAERQAPDRAGVEDRADLQPALEDHLLEHRRVVNGPRIPPEPLAPKIQPGHRAGEQQPPGTLRARRSSDDPRETHGIEEDPPGALLAG